MIRAKTLLLVLLIAATAHAETFGPGTHVVNGLIVTVPAGASVTITSPTSVVTLSGTTPSNPGPTDPIPNPTSELALSVKSAADAVQGDSNREETAGALALVYREGARLLADGTLKTTQQATEWARLGTNIALRQQGATAQWQPVRDAIGVSLDVLVREGKLTNGPQYGAAFAQIADGLSASAGDTTAFDFAKLLELLLKLLPVILALFGG